VLCRPLFVYLSSFLWLFNLASDYPIQTVFYLFEIEHCKNSFISVFIFISLAMVSPNGKLDFSRKNEKEPVMESHV
jgi:hypothetical protein